MHCMAASCPTTFCDNSTTRSSTGAGVALSDSRVAGVLVVSSIGFASLVVMLCAASQRPALQVSHRVRTQPCNLYRCSTSLCHYSSSMLRFPEVEKECMLPRHRLLHCRADELLHSQEECEVYDERGTFC